MPPKKPLEPEILAPEDDRALPVKRRTLDPLPALPDVPFKAAFWAAVRHRTLARALHEYNRVLSEALFSRQIIDQLHVADLESERVARLLHDAEDIHAVDRAKRKMKRLVAEDALKEQELTSRFSAQDRQRRKKVADQKHQAFLDADDTPVDDLTPAEEEALKELHARLRPARLRTLLDNEIQTIIVKQKPTEDDIKRMNRIADAIIKETFSP